VVRFIIRRLSYSQSTSNHASPAAARLAHGRCEPGPGAGPHTTGGVEPKQQGPRGIALCVRPERSAAWAGVRPKSAAGPLHRPGALRCCRSQQTVSR
jgi:hypothetical protein